MCIAGSHKLQLRTSSRFLLVITILNIVVLLLATTEFAKAADVIWLSCNFQNAKSTQKETKEQIYAFNEKDKKLWSYEPAHHQLVIVDNSRIERDLITAWPFRSQKGRGAASRSDANFEQNFVMYINRVTGAYFRGLPGVADTGSCSATKPQPVDDLRTKF